MNTLLATTRSDWLTTGRDTQLDFCSLNKTVKLTVLELSALCEWVITLAVDIIDHGRRRFLPHRSIGGFLTWVHSLSQRKKKIRLSSYRVPIHRRHGTHLYSNVPLPIVFTRPGG